VGLPGGRAFIHILAGSAESVFSAPEARIDNEIEKLAPALRVAAQIVPYFVVGLDLGAIKACSLRRVGHNFFCSNTSAK
jgi:hypothetical protein